MTVTKGSSITKKAAPLYTQLSNLYARLAKLLADPGPHNIVNNETAIGIASKHSSRFKKKAETWQLIKAASYIASMNDNGLIDMHINLMEGEQRIVSFASGSASLHMLVPPKGLCQTNACLKVPHLWQGHWHGVPCILLRILSIVTCGWDKQLKSSLRPPKKKRPPIIKKIYLIIYPYQ